MTVTTTATCTVIAGDLATACYSESELARYRWNLGLFEGEEPVVMSLRPSISTETKHDFRFILAGLRYKEGHSGIIEWSHFKLFKD